MANILLTNRCNLNCPYCFAINEMIKKNTVEDDELSSENFRIILDFLDRSKENKVRLMGGEPTLHPKFKEFIDYALSRNFKVHIFTNGLFSDKIADFLKKKGSLIKYSFNINPPDSYSSQKWNQILKNLKTLTSFKNSLIGSVIWQKDFKIDYLIDLAKRYSVGVVMLRIANPIVNQKNQYLALEQYPALAKNLIQEIKEANQNGVRIGFGCGFPKKMFNKSQLAMLKKYQVINLKWGCQGNSGRFDISPDLSVFRCFPLSRWHRKKLADFKRSGEIEGYFDKLMQKYQLESSKIDFINQGPCFAYLLNQAYSHH